MEQRVDKFCRYLSVHKPLYWSAVEKNKNRNPELFAKLGEDLLEWGENCLGENYIQIIADGYSGFVTDVNKSQMRYEVKKSYQYSTFAEGCENVYNNSEYGSLYHWGVFATTFAWEHHLQIFDFYQNFFLKKLNPAKGLVLDLGAGSGVWGLMLAKNLKGWRVSGVDISEKFVGYAREMADVNGFSDRATYNVGNALDFQENKPVEACICCFLLEHLETPEELLANISRNLEPGKRAFITGALTAAESDHITEFRRESELVLMAEKAGFRVESTFSGAPVDYPRSFNFLPRSMAMVLQKRHNDIW